MKTKDKIIQELTSDFFSAYGSLLPYKKTEMLIIPIDRYQGIPDEIRGKTRKTVTILDRVKNSLKRSVNYRGLTPCVLL